MTTPKFCLALGLVLAALTFTPNVYAHEGHDDTSAFTGAEGAADAPLSLNDESIANLDVRTKAAELKTLPEAIDMPATVTLIPEKRAVVTTRFDGLVRDIKVKIGQNVTQGQDLIVMEPVLPGTKIITYKAPISGTITQQNVVIGQPVTYETILIEVADTSEVLVIGSLYETSHIANLKSGQKATAQIGIYKDQRFEGVVQNIDAGPSEKNRVMNVYALFPNQNGALKPNLRGTLSVEVNSDEKPTVIIPASAVLENNGISFAFVREGNNFEKRTVETGRKVGGDVEIINGVFPDEAVVTQGNYQLQYLKPSAAPKPVEQGKGH